MGSRLSSHPGWLGGCVLLGQWDVGGYSPFLWEAGMDIQRHPLGLCSKGEHTEMLLLRFVQPLSTSHSTNYVFINQSQLARLSLLLPLHIPLHH